MAGVEEGRKVDVGDGLLWRGRKVFLLGISGLLEGAGGQKSVLNLRFAAQSVGEHSDFLDVAIDGLGLGIEIEWQDFRLAQAQSEPATDLREGDAVTVAGVDVFHVMIECIEAGVVFATDTFAAEAEVKGGNAEVLQEGRADAVLAASIFHFGEYSVSDVKAFLEQNGLPVRTL